MAPTQNPNQAAPADAAANDADDSETQRGFARRSAKPTSSLPGWSGIGSGQLSSTVFGGGPIVGVASTSKAQTIREFNHKNHYNQWQFIYDPDHGSRRTDHDAGAACVADGGSAAAAEFFEPDQSHPERRASFGGMQSRRGLPSAPAQSTLQPSRNRQTTITVPWRAVPESDS